MKRKSAAALIMALLMYLIGGQAAASSSQTYSWEQPAYDLRETGWAMSDIILDTTSQNGCWAAAAVASYLSSVSVSPGEGEAEELVSELLAEYGSYGSGGTPEMAANFFASRIVSVGGLPLRLVRAQWVDRETQALKRAVVSSGEVYTELYYDSRYYQQNSFSYYCGVEKAANHAVTLAGWDDSYPKERFASSPSADGAFLVRDSQGAAFGEGGYFWISYEDCSAFSNSVLFQAEEAEISSEPALAPEAGDIGRFYSQGSTLYFARLITAAEDMELKRVGLYTLGESTCQVRLYRTDRLPAPWVVLPSAASGVGSLPREGFYTVALKKAFEVKAGETYLVVVCLTASQGETAGTITLSGSGGNQTGTDGKHWSVPKEMQSGRSFFLKLYGKTTDSDSSGGGDL